MKIVITSDFGGFGLSSDAVRRYAELKGYNVIETGEERVWKLLLLHPTYSGSYEDMTDAEKEGLRSGDRLERNDPVLIQVVEELGERASGRYANLKIVEIPDDVDWEIMEYDGSEWIAERHRTWR
jgi:hypothetical protein